MKSKLNLYCSYLQCTAEDKIRFLGNVLHAKIGGGRHRHNKIGGRRIVTIEEGNKWLYDRILTGEPFAAVRYGGTEISTYKHCMAYYLGIQKELSQAVVNDLQRQSGFFPNDKSLLPKFRELMENDSNSIDFLASYEWTFENFMLRNFVPKGAIVSDNRALEPYYLGDDQTPWSKALEGKRVLVIHPFEDTIKKQYAKHELLFKNKDILPEFELHTLKAVQTIVGTKDDRFDTWFDALEWMYQEAMKIPFDVAILGCGAYGLSLACKLKRAGKQAVHIGGATQILFGIRGKRWELNSKEVSALFNEHWARPSAEETPQNKHKNEFGGAYW